MPERSKRLPRREWRERIMSADGPSSTQRHILVTLSFFMDAGGGNCYPSIETLVDRTGISKRTIERQLSAACDAGWVRRRARGTDHGQGWKRWTYEASVPVERGVTMTPPSAPERGVTTTPPSTPVENGKGGVTVTRRRRHSDAKGGVKMTPEREVLAGREREVTPLRIPSRLPSGWHEGREVENESDDLDEQDVQHELNGDLAPRARAILIEHCLLGRTAAEDSNGKRIGIGLLLRQLEDHVAEGFDPEELLGAVTQVRSDESAPPPDAAFSLRWFTCPEDPGRLSRTIGAWHKAGAAHVRTLERAR